LTAQGSIKFPKQAAKGSTEAHQQESQTARRSRNRHKTARGFSGKGRRGTTSGNNSGNKRSRSSSGLGDILRANNDATNQTLKDHEESMNVRHKETIALREKELNLEEKKVAVAERNADQAKETGAGLINALGQLAQAVLQLANK
jgi:hypothetical protein